MRLASAFAAVLLIAAPAAAQDTATAPRLEPVFTIIAELGDAVEVGQTGRGNRRIIPITGGTVEGEGISGTVRAGAWDWQLDRPDGCLDLIADYFLETNDGAVINVRNTATGCPRAEGAEAGPTYTRPQFEPPLGRYEWLGHGVYVGALERALDHPVPAVRIRVYQVR